MIPISDANPSLNKPLVTIFFIWVCVLIYIFVTPHNINQFNEYLYRYAAIPCELLTNIPVTDQQYYYITDQKSLKNFENYVENNKIKSINI